MHNRRATLRAFFRTARQLRLTLADPTTDIALPARDSSAQRPLSDDEAAPARLFAQRATSTRHAATVALLLAGAHTGELGHITSADLDRHAATVWAHGSAKRQPHVPPEFSFTIPSGPPKMTGWLGARNRHAGSSPHRYRQRCAGWK